MVKPASCQDVPGEPKDVSVYEKILGIALPKCAQFVDITKEGGVEFIRTTITGPDKSTWDGVRVDAKGTIYRLSDALNPPVILGSVSVDKLQRAREMILGAKAKN